MLGESFPRGELANKLLLQYIIFL